VYKSLGKLQKLDAKVDIDDAYCNPQISSHLKQNKRTDELLNM